MAWACSCSGWATGLRITCTGVPHVSMGAGAALDMIPSTASPLSHHTRWIPKLILRFGCGFGGACHTRGFRSPKVAAGIESFYCLAMIHEWATSATSGGLIQDFCFVGDRSKLRDFENVERVDAFDLEIADDRTVVTRYRPSGAGSATAFIAPNRDAVASNATLIGRRNPEAEMQGRWSSQPWNLDFFEVHFDGRCEQVPSQHRSTVPDLVLLPKLHVTVEASGVCGIDSRLHGAPRELLALFSSSRVKDLSSGSDRFNISAG
ncbi:hypothetical protein P154DRAFT_567142 [Amniculicola lignicola CBS 123094]|uniref:Uncharacterized protein n=1 Tax=Amniculicola lignicola CBS 123094 TaxID=1392246 RepID=A0A6A5W6I7_9PLEO|nr:hypothetical protein P154DRAFT_567142 [Amniculicola lignicola CBS 123094]